MVQDHTEVHRVVLPYRAWDLLGHDRQGTGAHAAAPVGALLRQQRNRAAAAEPTTNRASCCRSCSTSTSCSTASRATGKADDAWVDQFSKTIFEVHAGAGRRGRGRGAGGRHVARGHRRSDHARGESAHPARHGPHAATWKSNGKPHGQRAWRLHRRPRLRLRERLAQHGARRQRAELLRQPHPRRLSGGARPRRARRRFPRTGSRCPWSAHVKAVKTTDPDGLLREADEAIRGNLQARAAAVIHRYGELGHDPRGPST